MDILLWSLAVILVIAGVVGTVLPALPGTALVFAGLLLGAWIDGFTAVGAITIAVLGLLTVLAWVAEYVAGMLGAKRAGAGRLALLGAAIGTVLGVFTGLWGLIFMPLAGAAIGEYLEMRDIARAGHVGVSTWIGIMLGTAVKIAITFAMIGIFVAALIF
ncbi:DUF456 domain-containing protein [Quisquiliibacterium transsilvanicum]|uniref:DUF456 domain-containing protein n=1 Tax=Quisquiliibacterium transsilvanicum TaxID=1549638 RepID=A0A7W8HFW4_9BURK|nr:DUF456 domain-containing protein [Quisquiliibacterium transsilvanicum]MBB5271173.1 hypothetical protein [Quisquiliibacterium transsilvanicum]